MLLLLKLNDDPQIAPVPVDWELRTARTSFSIDVGPRSEAGDLWQRSVGRESSGILPMTYASRAHITLSTGGSVEDNHGARWRLSGQLAEAIAVREG